jgi:hypothetical protein
MKNRYVEIFIMGVFLFFSVIFVLDAIANPTKSYFITRNPITFKEAMTDLMPQTVDRPFSLLEGVLPLKNNQTRGNLNSQRCYEGDFQRRLESVGNYIQRTNNYKHEDAESCSSPYQEFITAYYDVKPLA